MEVHNSYILDIENELKIIEEIFDRYIETDECAVFVPNRRFPIESKVKLTNHFDQKHLRNVKYLSYKCLGFVSEALLNIIYMNSVDPDMYYSNDLLKYITPKSFVDVNRHEPSVIIYDYLEYVSDNEVRIIDDVIYNISQTILIYIQPYHDYIYEINCESKFIVLKSIDNIFRFRLQECYEDQEYEKELSEDERREHNK